MTGFFEPFPYLGVGLPLIIQVWLKTKLCLFPYYNFGGGVLLGGNKLVISQIGQTRLDMLPVEEETNYFTHKFGLLKSGK